MPASAKLFSVVDIITVTTGILFDRRQQAGIRELACHVSDLPSIPKRGTDARAALVAAVGMQLPYELRRLDQFALIELIMELKAAYMDEDDIRSRAYSFLATRFGRELPLIPAVRYRSDSCSLALLRAIAENPTAIPLVSLSEDTNRRHS